MGVITVASNDFEVVDPKEVFRGLTYGQWIGVWYNNLLSDKPDIVYREGKSIAFLRGNVEYSYDEQEDPKNPTNRIFSSLTKEQTITIQRDTAVLIPVITTQLVLGDDYAGQVMNDELSVRSAARRDTVNGGPVGAQIRKFSNGKWAAPSRLVRNLDDHYVETPLFPLSVSKGSSIRKKIETPIEAGPYQALVAGVFVIIYNLNKGLYRLSFYGRGVGRYTTRSVYDINVEGNESRLVDVSGGETLIPGQNNLMNFVNDIK